MKYFDIKTIIDSYKSNSISTTNKFWGLLAIFSSIDSKITACKDFEFDSKKVSLTLERIFQLGTKKNYNSNSMWGVILSNNWVEYVSKELLKCTPNIYEVLIWYYRNIGFDDSTTHEELVESFLKDIHLPLEIASKIFDFKDVEVSWNTANQVEESDLLESLNSIIGNSKDYSTITIEKTFVAANPGELSRAPFVQPLYSGQGIQECLILTQFNFSDLYRNHSTSICKMSSSNNFSSALLTKPFLLLAGISGTGKSRIVRELARACWKPDNEEFKAHKPSNFEMIQVKPNWHDSSELLGYVSRISGKPEFVAGDFLRFIVKAWENRNVPYFLCLDEMNLAPVEQYFAEYLSVIETRKLENGEIVTDPILKVNAEQWYIDLIHKLTSDEILSKQFLERGIAIPQNLFVVGTVNMDETTFSFSRKVLDRAMTIEMNEVDLEGGLENDGGDGFGYIGEALHAQFVEGKDVYSDYKELCDKVISYLKSVNEKLEGTPFKIAYRTRNEFLVYAVNRWLLSDGQDVFLNVIDEMTSMKILSRIEGDADKVGSVLDDLKSLLEGAFGESELKTSSVSLSKLKEMTKKLEKTQYTSFWL